MNRESAYRAFVGSLRVSAIPTLVEIGQKKGMDGKQILA
jgi:hypothetical protein